MVRSWFTKKENGKIIKFQTAKDMSNYYNCSVRCLYNRIESDNKNKAKKFGTDKCFREENIQYYCDTCRMPCDSKDIICSECE